MINIEPTLNDLQVMQFIHNGYITLGNIVDADFNKECESVDGGWLNDFVRTDEFRRNVLLHPEVAGVARSLLGANFLVPTSAHHHLFEAPHRGQTWHSDGITEYGYGINTSPVLLLSERSENRRWTDDDIARFPPSACGSGGDRTLRRYSRTTLAHRSRRHHRNDTLRHLA